MAKVYRDDDVDLSALYGRRVAVLGYGRLGQTHALCLRDSGVDVVVGVAAGDPRRSAAEAEGLSLAEPAEACAGADIVAVAVRPSRQASLYTEVVAPHLPAGATLIAPDPLPAGLPGLASNIGIVSLQASPVEARRRYVDGRGVPAVVAVAADAEGTTLGRTLSYARALGCTRAGAVLSTAPELTHAHEFARAAVGTERLGGILRAALTVLSEAGCDDDVAVLSCWTALREAAESVAAGAAPAGSPAAAEPEELARLRRLDAELRAGTAAAHPA